MPTLTSLHADLLVLIRALLTDSEVVQLRFTCRCLQRAFKPPRTTQLCPGTWRVPELASTDTMEAVRSHLEKFVEEDRPPYTPLQWGYLVDFTGELQ